MSIKRNLKTVTTLIVFVLMLHSELAVGQSINPKFQAVFINGVARKIIWSGQSTDFNILIVGNDKALENELNKLAADRRINGKAVKVQMTDQVSGTLNQDIVFVSSRAKGQLDAVAKSVSKDTIIMTAFDGAFKSGSHLNFFLSGNKISFNLNQSSMSKTNLKSTDDLVKLASKVL